MTHDELQIQYSKFTAVNEPSIVLPQRETWGELVHSLSRFRSLAPDCKYQAMLFNGVTFNGYRDNAHAKEMYLLVLDYDEGMTIDEAVERFEQYEYVIYSSWSHQHTKHESPPCDRFRVVFPLSVPISKAQWKNKKDTAGIAYNLISFAGPVDHQCMAFSQCYTMPAHRHGDTPVFIHHRGELLDISGWEETKKPVVTSIKTTDGVPSTVTGEKRTLPPDTIFTTKHGPVNFSDVTGMINGVLCPIHGDTNPGEFLSGNDFSAWFVCHKCGTYFRSNARNDDDFIKEFLKSMKDKAKKKSERIIEPLKLDVPDFALPYDQDKRQKMLLKKFGKLKSEYNLVFAAEGFGKSHLAVHWAKKGHKVIFACKSNAQAEEQSQRFVNEGLDVELITGADYRLRTQYGIIAEYYGRTSPWEGERVNENATIKKIKTIKNITQEEATAFWESLKLTNTPSDDDHKVVVTTHARVQAWGRVQHSQLGEIRIRQLRRNLKANKKSAIVYPDKTEYVIKPETIIVIDDPSYDDFTMLYPFTEKLDSEEIEKLSVGGENKRTYFVRSSNYMFGHGFVGTHFVFTTTELITSELIKKYYPEVFAPDNLMPDEKLYGGQVEVYSTKLVRAKTDGLIPVILQRIKKLNPDIEYIADGQGNKYNMINNKGVNVLKTSDLIIEISSPHLNKAILLCDELGWSQSDLNSMKTIIAIDQAHQAIGRNSGYRWHDRKHEQFSPPTCLVLIDPLMYKNFLGTSRYYINKVGELDKEPRPRPDKDDWRDHLLFWIKNHIQYMSTGEYLYHDTLNSVKEPGLLHKDIRAKRIMKAIYHILEQDDITKAIREKITKTVLRIEQDIKTV